MNCDLNKFDPLPKLGAKAKPVESKKPDESLVVFERSRLYDVALHIETAIREDIAKYGFTAYWL